MMNYFLNLRDSNILCDKFKKYVQPLEKLFNFF